MLLATSLQNTGKEQEGHSGPVNKAFLGKTGLRGSKRPEGRRECYTRIRQKVKKAWTQKLCSFRNLPREWMEADERLLLLAWLWAPDLPAGNPAAVPAWPMPLTTRMSGPSMGSSEGHNGRFRQGTTQSQQSTPTPSQLDCKLVQPS